MPNFFKSQIDSANMDSSSVRPFIASLAMIVVSEVGDKTFLVAALMAMRYDRLSVFCAAFVALLFMSILSAVLGHALPSLLPPWATHALACFLYLAFGFRMLWEALNMHTPSVHDELREVENDIALHGSTLPIHEIDSHNDIYATGLSSTKQVFTNKLHNLLSFAFTPVFVQTFIMTFVGEWGDRSQFATIAMAADSDYALVLIGTIVGHSLCTACAVLGGRFLATRISIRQVTIAGAVLFLVFGLLSLISLLRHIT